MLELSPALPKSDLQWCVAQAAGNPFYLHALARHMRDGSVKASVPVDIHSLAAVSYFALSQDARLVLESCLVLGSFATIARVRSVTSEEDISLLSAFRQLEEQELVRLVDGAVYGPHSLLSEGIRGLIPPIVSALVNRRVAEVLADECTTMQFSSALALAAAECWISSGDAVKAVTLLRRCAAEAASVGEPAAAAELLHRIVRPELSLATRSALLDDVIRYADAGGARALATDALRARLLGARDMDEPAEALRQLELRIIEADLLNGTEFTSAIQPFTALLENPDSDHTLRVQAIIRLLVIADSEYDTALADKLFTRLQRSETNDAATDNDIRARLVYHTTFGSNDQAYGLARELISRFPNPAVDEACRKARAYASMSLYRMLRTADAREILETDYDFWAAGKNPSEALYAASLLTEIAISEGDLELAREWFAESEAYVRVCQFSKFCRCFSLNSVAARAG